MSLEDKIRSSWGESYLVLLQWYLAVSINNLTADMKDASSCIAYIGWCPKFSPQRNRKRKSWICRMTRWGRLIRHYHGLFRRGLMSCQRLKRDFHRREKAALRDSDIRSTSKATAKEWFTAKDINSRTYFPESNAKQNHLLTFPRKQLNSAINSLFPRNSTLTPSTLKWRLSYLLAAISLVASSSSMLLRRSPARTNLTLIPA